MIQFNLLPDVKVAYIKTQRTKRIVMLTSLIVTAVSFVLATVLFVSVQVVQKKHLNDISKDIEGQTKKLSEIEDLNKILTIQNQLASLPALHDGKPVSSRLLGYIAQVTPSRTATTFAFISKLDVDFTENTIKITGTADGLATVNKYVDSLKFATYKTSTVEAGKPFSNVVTTSNRTNSTGKNDDTSYLIALNFDPILFSNTEKPVLTVPNIVSTRSETEKPAAIFKEDPTPVKKEE